jgi:SAM-dependent methyltransferase
MRFHERPIAFLAVTVPAGETRETPETRETRETYDLIVAEYARRNATLDPQGRDDAAALAARLSPGSLVLDVGCGPAREMTVLRKLGLRVTGVDVSMGQLRAAGVGGVAQADMRLLPVRNRSLDALWCRAALLHIARAWVPEVIEEFARAVRPGGELVLAVAEGDGEGWEAARNYRSEHRRWFSYHREPELTALLSAEKSK